MMKKLYITAIIFTLALTSLGGILAFGNQTAQAASSSDWNASNIIDDAVFYDNTAMSTADIQNFMNSKNPSCDTQGTRPASEYGRSDLTHAQYAASVGWPGPPYVCLRDYYQVPRSDQNINNLSTNVRPEGSISAAEIIKRASDTYGLNPKVLLVLIQKESVGPLLTDTWPIPAQYRSVVGYACPDTAPCDPKYAGFYNQIMNAAYQFKYYKDHAYDKDIYGRYIYNHQPYNTVALRFNPNASCGSTQTRMDNYATTGLYNYTPYQPNQAALNNMYGTGDDCSAYGNRNFWRMFIDWFGSTRGYVSLETPRWMTVTVDTHKKDPLTGQNVDTLLPKGTQIKLTTKTYINGRWYLRTEYDTNNNIQKGLLHTEVADIPTSPLESPRYMQLNSDRVKWNPATGSVDASKVFPKGINARFIDKITVNGATLYRTEYDSKNNNNLFITSSGVSEIDYQPFVEPRFMRLDKDSTKINPATQQSNDTTLPKGTQLKFTSKITVANILYFRVEADTDSNTPIALPASSIESITYEQLSDPVRWMRIKADTRKYHPATESPIDAETFKQGTDVLMSQKITINGQTYYRTKYDMDHKIDRAFPLSALEEISYINLTTPKNIEISQDTRKLNPKTGVFHSDGLILKGNKLTMTSKIEVNGQQYYRTQYDTDNNLEKAIDGRYLIDN